MGRLTSEVRMAGTKWGSIKEVTREGIGMFFLDTRTTSIMASVLLLGHEIVTLV